jgi:thioredoxin-related protein
MKKRIFLTILLMQAVMVAAVAQGGSAGVRRAEKLTEKGFIDKKTVFDPVALDSLIKTDEYVMLFVSFEGCIPCEWLRTSDIFDIYPITPYYSDYLLGGNNETLPHAFYPRGFPTCLLFDGTGEIVAVTVGTKDYYDVLDSIVNEKEKICMYSIPGIADENMLPFLNLSHKANVAYIKGDMDGVFLNATRAMEIHPNFYNRYLLYRYYSEKNDHVEAAKYKSLALENISDRDRSVYKNLIGRLE